MTTPIDVEPVQEAPTFSALPQRHDEEERATITFQEINERRSRVENSELLQQLRGL